MLEASMKKEILIGLSGTDKPHPGEHLADF